MSRQSKGDEELEPEQEEPSESKGDDEGRREGS